ncbi:LysR substrate-binding domain-containing protein [Actinokineospora sp. NBRC 105648]|uniref:LysR family transcriptional regulator n=1 Tax=Actinokineospora sp. NBRC 105648 TaxID=3032206 RepID=UPI0024A3DF8D|nr:LysR substrate-binding domain-containing protein [Actinokineospora sp. NBRC 105648]GLZ42366.1 LysR family transcriptional regulator [Actinokineospora sp. NBRC 105648]
MELRQLAYFLAVAEEGSFTRAAAREHVAQPGVSAQIRQLERELGHPLFDRGRAVRLTQAGEVLLPYARSALRAAADARLAMDELAGLLRGRVTVGMLTATPADELVELLGAFHARHPAVEVSLREDTSDRLVAGLLDGSVDLAWVSVSGSTPAGLEGVPLTDTALVAVVAAADPLAGKTSVRLAALRDRVLGSLPRGSGLRSALEDACAVAGFAPRVGFEASAPEVLARLAAKGMGVAVVPVAIAELHRDRVRRVELTHPVPRGRIELAWRASGPLSPPARTLVAMVRAGLE